MRCFNKNARLALALAVAALALPAGIAQAGDGGPPPKPVIHASLSAAYEAATADQSLVLLIFSAEWCGPCQMLKKDVLDSPAFLDHAGPLHIIDIDVDANSKTASEFEVSSIPAIFLLTGDAKIVARRVGYIDSSAFLTWIDESRERVKRGQWDGAAPGGKLAALVHKAATGGLDSGDIAALAGMLEDPDSGERAAAGKLLLEQREEAMPVLLNAVTNSYLGARIAAAELLRKLAPDAPAFEPWQPPSSLGDALSALRKWWAGAGRLPVASEPAKLDPALKGSIETALQKLSGDDPVRRAEAMSALTDCGSAALPEVREALHRAERTGDHRLALLLEDVRWSILIPETLERQVGGARQSLAHGASPEQQAAAARLGSAGNDAIAPLAELAASNDPLVVESAIRALSSIGGGETISAMAALLKSEDSNLRMTAAQALGHTKDSSAVKHLVTAVDDPNEVVACAAIGGLEEVNAVEYGSPKNIAAGTEPALKRCLSDSRWRVRAAAAEAVGKLNIVADVPDLKKLMDDPDGFVVRTALTALRSLSSQPDTAQLVAMSKRLPSLRGDVVAIIAQRPDADSAKEVTGIYEQSSVSEQAAILAAISKSGEDDDTPAETDVWKPLLDKAAVSPEAQIRRAAARAVHVCGHEAASGLETRLLADEDRETRAAAAEAALAIISRSQPGGRMTQAGWTSYSPLAEPGNASKSKTNNAIPAETLAAWHHALLTHPDSSQNLGAAAALYLTGDGQTDLPALAGGFKSADADAMTHLAQANVPALILAKLTWPAGKTALDGLTGSPVAYAIMTAASGRASGEVSDYLHDPARFRAALEPASGKNLELSIELLASQYSRYGQSSWSLLTPGPKTTAIVNELAGSTNAALRAVAIHLLGVSDPASHAALFDAAIKETNSAVRVAGVQGVARMLENDRSALENRLGPLVADSDPEVSGMAVVALLEPEVRGMAGLEEALGELHAGQANVSMIINSGSTDRPLSPLDGKPAFLDPARLHATQDAPATAARFIVLLAQYGQFDGIDRLAATIGARKAGNNMVSRDGVDSALLAAIALSHDAKYIPALRKIAGNNTYELQRVLQAARGMSGPEARQFRLDINQQIRKSSNTISD